MTPADLRLARAIAVLEGMSRGELLRSPACGDAGPAVDWELRRRTRVERNEVRRALGARLSRNHHLSRALDAWPWEPAE